MAGEEAWGKVFNVACGESTSVNKLYKYISQILKKETKIEYKPTRKGDIKNSLANISETTRVLGYIPKFSILDGLEKTISWYKETYK